jgi:hypothetical protein
VHHDASCPEPFPIYDLLHASRAQEELAIKGSTNCIQNHTTSWLRGGSFEAENYPTETGCWLLASAQKAIVDNGDRHFIYATIDNMLPPRAKFGPNCRDDAIGQGCHILL